MHKLIMLRGNSGSGKTTVAKELQTLFGRGTMVLSQDMIRREVLKEKDYLGLIKETTITEDKSKDEIINEIYLRVCNG